MAWQQYVDNMITNGKACKAGVFSVDGAPWACTPGWNLTQQEVQQVVQCIKDENARGSAYANGLRLAGIKFKVVRFEEGEIWKGAAKEPEESCCCAYLCNTCVLIAIAIGGHHAAGDLNVAVQRVCGHLKGHGY